MNRFRSVTAATSAPHLRLVPGSVLPVQQSIVTAKEKSRSVSILNRMLDEMRNSGFLAKVIERAKLAGVEVAPKVN